MNATRICSVDECTRPVVSFKSGICRPHYQRLRKHGNVNAGPRIVDRSLSPEERFWGYVDRSVSCWIWNGRTGRRGYGRFSPTREKSVQAHRYSYELLIGPIPDGLVLDHLCRVTGCVNPEHLEPVTARENVLRGFGPTAIQARQTHCKRGHEFTPENTWRCKKGFRNCRTCLRTYSNVKAKETRECPNCGNLLKRGNLRRHIRMMHS